VSVDAKGRRPKRVSAKREHPGTFDRDLTVTGVNNGEQQETPVPEIWLEKAVF
jgi:hypothetical protein